MRYVPVDVTCHLAPSHVEATWLTGAIGDERPCQRCIKRGLQDACQDGVRKKAKYRKTCTAPDANVHVDAK